MTHEMSAEETFGAQVRDAREARGWTQDRLRRLLRDVGGVDLSPTAMTRLEQGKRPIRLNEVTALAQLLELGLDRYGGAAVRLAQDDDYERAKAELHRLEAEHVDALASFEEARRMADTARAVEAQAHQHFLAIATQVDQLRHSLRQYEAGREQHEAQRRLLREGLRSDQGGHRET